MNLPYLHGAPVAQGTIRQQNSDFYVEELLGFEPDGQGEHLFIWLEKSGQNTGFVAKALAKAYGVSTKTVSYSGMKDRHAVARQWFCLPYPIKKALPPTPQIDGVEILKIDRHGRKLKTGTHKSNLFKITIALSETDPDIEARLQAIKAQGVPNYFGEQRFGRNGDNVEQALQMFRNERVVKDRKVRGILLSAVRSQLFNEILSERINQGLLKPLDGEAFMLVGSNSFFQTDCLDEALLQRYADNDIELSIAMFGIGELASDKQVKAVEQAVAENNKELVDGLVEAGLKQERRSAKLRPEAFSWQINDNSVTLSFQLTSGAFATSILREVAQYQDLQR